MRLFEEFNLKTLDKNISKYNTYIKGRKTRSELVAWGVVGGQERNFQLASTVISKGDSVLDYGCGIGDFYPYLKNMDKEPSKYLGVDINPTYIKIANDLHKNINFKLIKSINDIDGKYDCVCAIGVFTWFITREDFISCIEKLYDIANKSIALTFNRPNVFNAKKSFSKRSHTIDDDKFWGSEYRYYTPELLDSVFPNIKFSYTMDNSYLLAYLHK